MNDYDLRAVGVVAGAFDSFGNSQTFWLVLLGFVFLVPAFLLVHELGHAWAALATTQGLVDVRIGRTPSLCTAKLGRLRLNIHFRPPDGGVLGETTAIGLHDRRSRIAYALGGPFLHLATAVGVIAVGIGVNISVVTGIGELFAIYGALNLVPWRSRWSPSDGAQVIAVLRSQPDPVLPQAWFDELRAAQVRFSALVTQANSAGLGATLTWARPAAGLARENSSELGTALSRLAFAGWCWREVESSDLTPIRSELEAVWESATVANRGEIPLTPYAAALALGRVDLRRGSYGASEIERQIFLESAFTWLPAELHPPGLTLKQEWRAFGFGVAVHDLETVTPAAREQRELRG